MVRDEVRNFLRAYRGQYPDAQIRQRLLQDGVPAAEIAEPFREAGAPAAPPPPPPPSGPRALAGKPAAVAGAVGLAVGGLVFALYPGAKPSAPDDPCGFSAEQIAGLTAQGEAYRPAGTAPPDLSALL